MIENCCGEEGEKRWGEKQVSKRGAGISGKSRYQGEELVSKGKQEGEASIKR